jgi:hypothetical protein
MTYRFFSCLSLLCALLAPATASADASNEVGSVLLGEATPDPSKPYGGDPIPSDDGFGAQFGVNLLLMHSVRSRPHWPFFSGNIPTLDVDFPIWRRFIQIELGWKMQWGFTKFYLDNFPIFPSLGLRIYPNGKYLSVIGKGSWETFLFNNSTLNAEAGVDIDIPTGHDGWITQYLTLGASVSHREVNRAADFIQKDQWWLTGNAVGFHLGFRARKLGE